MCIRDSHGMPPITRVYKTTRDGKRLTLEQECLQSGTLPSIAYGFKRCSLKHKLGPQEKFCNCLLYTSRCVSETAVWAPPPARFSGWPHQG